MTGVVGSWSLRGSVKLATVVGNLGFFPACESTKWGWPLVVSGFYPKRLTTFQLGRASE